MLHIVTGWAFAASVIALWGSFVTMVAFIRLTNADSSDLPDWPPYMLAGSIIAIVFLAPIWLVSQWMGV